jgi:hypothetical protein
MSAATPPSLSAIRRALGARKGWGLLHTYGRLTVLERSDGTEQWIACVYASRTGDQGVAHECVCGVGATGVAALEDLAKRAAELPPPTERKNDGHPAKPSTDRAAHVRADATSVRTSPDRPAL